MEAACFAVLERASPPDNPSSTLNSRLFSGVGGKGVLTGSCNGMTFIDAPIETPHGQEPSRRRRPKSDVGRPLIA
jgi:hypothetical protein